jgi:hypothetical protein|tara:strand:- start:761 stop:1633 length:873 start_codon:yes stop_codon:yes gene_type:complete
MATNPHFKPQKGEQDVIEELTVEMIKIHGHDFVYLPRTLVKEDELFGEDVLSKFSNGIEIEMYIDSVDGFEGEGDFISKFGLEIRDSMSLVLSKKRFTEEVTPVVTDVLNPREGDLIYFPKTGGMFEIKFVEHENPFYQLSKLYTYKLSCELFQYSQEDIDTGWTTVDKVESDRMDYVVELTMTGGVTGSFYVGEYVFDNATYATSTNTAEIITWTTATKVMQISGQSGSIGAVGITGQSGGYAVVGSTADPSTTTVIPTDTYSDNRDFQIEADDIFDFTDQDPFSEGNY